MEMRVVPSRQRIRRAISEAWAELPSVGANRVFGWPGSLADLEREIRERYDRVATPLNEYGYDPFGFDKNSALYPGLLMAIIYRYWFRVETSGIEHVPSKGPVLVVANHEGNTFAWDAAMIGTAVFLEAEPPRHARGLGEFYLPTIPFFNQFMARMGSVVGTPENCRQLFEHGECVLVFPEGARGFIKPYRKAYQLQRFGLGFMRLALEHRVPILPVGVVGSAEQSPGLADVKWIGRLIGAPGFPITVTMPWLGLLGIVPLPAKFRINFGPVMRFDGSADAEDAEIQPKVDSVKAEIQRLIQVGLSQRNGWFS
jgi:1-acyl-sn-glycerol-3-phosphate acyltransferase